MDSTVKVVPGVTYFLVVKVTFQQGNERFELWVDPTPGKPLPAPDAVKEDYDEPVISSQNFGGDGAAQYDELRIGKTWQDVSPTMDPVLLQNQTDNRIAMLTYYGAAAQSSTVTTPNLPADWRVVAYGYFDAGD